MSPMQLAKGGGQTIWIPGEVSPRSQSGINVFEIGGKCFAALTEFENVELIDKEDTKQTKPSSLGGGNEGNVHNCKVKR